MTSKLAIGNEFGENDRGQERQSAPSRAAPSGCTGGAGEGPAGAAAPETSPPSAAEHEGVVDDVEEPASEVDAPLEDVARRVRGLLSARGGSRTRRMALNASLGQGQRVEAFLLLSEHRRFAPQVGS